MLGGLLLLVPRTTMLGALICLADMVQVFVLNMTYDFGLKQISFHLILMSLFLLAPDFAAWPASSCSAGRTAAVHASRRSFRTPRANRLALAAQIVFGVYLVGMYTQHQLNYWNVVRRRRVSEVAALRHLERGRDLSVDGQVRSPHLNDYDRRWRRVIFDEPDIMVFERTDDSFAHYGVSVDVNTRTHDAHQRQQPNVERLLHLRAPVARSPDPRRRDGRSPDPRAALSSWSSTRSACSTARFRWIRPPDPYAG